MYFCFMTKETLQYLSISFETMSFFAIAFDLYGETRLNNLSNRIKNYKPNTITKILTTSIFILLYLYISSILIDHLLYTDYKNGFYFSGIIVGWFLIDVIKSFSRLTIYLIKFVLNSFPIKGTLTAIGTILFLISKLYQLELIIRHDFCCS